MPLNTSMTLVLNQIQKEGYLLQSLALLRHLREERFQQFVISQGYWPNNQGMHLVKK